jgi:phosphohistidine phosphatase
MRPLWTRDGVPPVKTLTLLRHAKSGWDDTVPRDFDRPLNPKGRRAAAMVGRHLRSLGVGFDHVVASPAVRVEETLGEVQSGLGLSLQPAFDRRIYLASAATLLDVVHDLPAEADRVLLVGHNPGLEELVLMLVPGCTGCLREEVEQKYPTATVAEMTMAGNWSDAGNGTAALTRFIRPRDLDPTLGPDAD